MIGKRYAYDLSTTPEMFLITGVQQRNKGWQTSDEIRAAGRHKGC